MANDVVDGVGVPECLYVDACSFHGMIEIPFRRRALEDCSDDGSDGVKGNVSHDNASGLAERAVFWVGGEDA